jgi:putative tryptophan/tyrosine transport system substrate-binding protein
MNRRTFLSALTLGTLAAPLAGEGQPARKIYRIGFLANGNQTTSRPSVEAFRQGLRELGWVEGQNVSIEYRWADGKLDRLPALASDLVKTPVDVLLVSGVAGIRAALQATRTVPIVSSITSDPVVYGFATSFARPGGSVTGLATQFEDLATKQLQLLKETVPRAARVAILAQHISTSLTPAVQKAAEAAVRALGLNAQVFEIRDVAELDAVFRTAKAERADAMLVLPSPTFNRYRARLAEFAVRHRLPAIYESKEYVEAGGLMCYGPNFSDMFRRSASYVDRILKGAKPGDLPIEQPEKFELVINLKTAKALGLTIPQTILLQANQVIE